MLSKNEDIADVIRVHLKNSGGILVAGLDQTINQKLLNVLLKMIPDEMSVTAITSTPTGLDLPERAEIVPETQVDWEKVTGDHTFDQHVLIIEAIGLVSDRTFFSLFANGQPTLASVRSASAEGAGLAIEYLSGDALGVNDSVNVRTFFREVFSVVAYVNSDRMEFKKVLGVTEEGILLCEEF